MSVVLVALTILVLAGYLKSYRRDRRKTTESARYSLDMLVHLLPYIIIGIWLTGVFFSFIPDETIQYMLDDTNIMYKIPIVCLIAMIFPGPRYIIYPLAAGLALRGISIGIVVAYLTADVLIDPSCVLLESKMLGRRYYMYRFTLSLLIASLGGYLTYLLIPNTLMFK